MILFFDRLLERVAATAFFQNMMKAMMWRKRQVQLPIYEIIEKRAAHCIQSVWSDWKIKKRMIALSSIKRHVESITSSTLYIE
jgi:hypothetical protein